MIEKVFDNIYRIAVPLPLPQVRSMNSYIIVDHQRSLVVDPGMAHDTCFGVVREAIEELGLDRAKIDFFVTHHHLDHFGLVSRIMTDGSVIYVHRIEATIIEMIASRAVLRELIDLLYAMGFPEKDPEQAVPELLGREYGEGSPWPFRYVDEGDTIEKGGMAFLVLATPGHSPGHLCLYEPEHGILVSGDTVSPVVQFPSPNGNYAQRHIESLDRLDGLKVTLVLPGHGPVFSNIRQAVESLRRYQEERNRVVLAALENGDKDPYHLAASVPGLGNWETATNLLKFRATRECLARLLYLEFKGKVQRETGTQSYVYSLKR